MRSLENRKIILRCSDMVSPKLRSVILKAYKTNREIGIFDESLERECINSGMMRYSNKPLMKITMEGRFWASNQERIKSHG